jgi:hypothetical protein
MFIQPTAHSSFAQYDNDLESLSYDSEEKRRHVAL